MRVSVRQFQELHKLSDIEMDELDKSMLMVQIITGKSTAEIAKMRPAKFRRICNEANKLLSKGLSDVDDRNPEKIIRVNGKWYQLHYDITRLDAGRYVELQTFATDPIGNLHKLLASMAVPLRWTWRGLRAQKYDANRHAEISEAMLEADFATAYNALVFFWAVYEILMQSLPTYGSPQEEELLGRLLRLSQRFGAGSITAKWYLNLKA